jgi:hypothetical protein
MNWKGGIGRIFKVTQDNEIVWEFWNPFEEKVYRAYRYLKALVDELISNH